MQLLRTILKRRLFVTLPFALLVTSLVMATAPANHVQTRASGTPTSGGPNTTLELISPRSSSGGSTLTLTTGAPTTSTEGTPASQQSTNDNSPAPSDTPVGTTVPGSTPTPIDQAPPSSVPPSTVPTCDCSFESATPCDTFCPIPQPPNSCGTCGNAGQPKSIMCPMMYACLY